MVDGIKNARYVIETNLDVLKNLGVILCIENTGYLGNDLIKDFGALAAFVDKFPKNLVGVAFDIAHANIMDGVLTGLRTLTKRIRHVHLADNNKLPQNHHMPIGKGSIDFKPIFKTLTSKDLTIILEITPDSAWQKNLMDGRQFLLDRMN
jgi:sugar phosphate isomerase/epimerase